MPTTRIVVGSPPTERQVAVLRHIGAHVQRCGHPPTMREMIGLLGLRSGMQAVTDHYRVLCAKGLLEREPRVARGLRITQLGRGYL